MLSRVIGFFWFFFSQIFLYFWALPRNPSVALNCLGISVDEQWRIVIKQFVHFDSCQFSIYSLGLRLLPWPKMNFESGLWRVIDVRYCFHMTKDWSIRNQSFSFAAIRKPVWLDFASRLESNVGVGLADYEQPRGRRNRGRQSCKCKILRSLVMPWVVQNSGGAESQSVRWSQLWVRAKTFHRERIQSCSDPQSGSLPWLWGCRSRAPFSSSCCIGRITSIYLRIYLRPVLQPVQRECPSYAIFLLPRTDAALSFAWVCNVSVFISFCCYGMLRTPYILPAGLMTVASTHHDQRSTTLNLILQMIF